MRDLTDQELQAYVAIELAMPFALIWATGPIVGLPAAARKPGGIRRGTSRMAPDSMHPLKRRH